MKHCNLQLSSFKCDIFVINITGIGLLNESGFHVAKQNVAFYKIESLYFGVLNSCSLLIITASQYPLLQEYLIQMPVVFNVTNIL